MNRIHLLGVAAIGLCLPSFGVAAQRVRLLDPLTAAELRGAEQLARADSQVRRLIGERRHVLSAISFVALKQELTDTAAPSREPAPLRAALVVFYVYDGDFGVRALVDLARRAVRSAELVEEEPIPMAREEIATAQRLALADPRLRERLGARPEALRVEWLGVRAVDRSDPCYRRRCVQLLFRRDNLFLTRPIVIVDLTGGTVRMEEP